MTNKKRPFLTFILFLASLLSNTVHADPDRAQLAVWANEAIIATYTFNYKTYLEDQKNIAKYFTSDGWIAYSKALNASKLPEIIKQNSYDVTAVATQPPKLVFLGPTHWQATMNILVVYQNDKYNQRQNLKVILGFSTAPEGQGIRGFSVDSLQSTVTEPPCQCPIKEETSAPAPATTPEDEKQ